jgi:transposase
MSENVFPSGACHRSCRSPFADGSRRVGGAGSCATCRPGLPPSHDSGRSHGAVGAGLDQQFPSSVLGPAVRPLWRWRDRGRRDRRWRPPCGIGAPPKAPSGRKPGKQPGAKGKWRDEPLKTERSQSHWPAVCAQCGTTLELWDAVVGTAEAFPVLELERVAGGIRIACVEHRYAVVRCACGHATAARPGTGALSFLEGDGTGSCS